MIATLISLFLLRNLDTINGIYNLTTYPNNLAFLQGGVNAIPNAFFAEDVVGRVTPLGDLSGIEDTVEYFFALTPDPSPPTYATWTNATATVVYGKATGVAFWRFDDDGAVLKFDAWIPTLQQWWNTTHDVSHYPVNEALVRQQLCQTTQAKCAGTNKQWDSVDQCVTALNQKPMVTFDNLWGDNVWCKALHVRLTPIRPDAHCTHAGPSGGGKCVNMPYNEAYFDDGAVFGEPSGETFVCPGTDI
ncbi:hypothetical protein F5883DRAFT_667634 [Diaporthe sp. PMI_573]|nr:hypothetical protein F5883DRAFT_667634 [Diaporthaceae sp. PMI_573]